MPGRTVPQPESASFRSFFGGVIAPDIVSAVAAFAGVSSPEVARHLAMAAAEAAQSLRVLAGLQVNEGERILEVGAGLGLTAGFLASSGFDVSSIEPGGTGFDDHQRLAAAVAAALDLPASPLPLAIEDLDANAHGRFSVVFSNNVIEHVDDPGAALDRIDGLLLAHGVSVHSCPNYSVPYEPHFGVPLIPRAPQLTERVLPRSIADTGLWRSLNFVAASDVEEFASTKGRSLWFRTDALAVSVERLATDEEFRSRHRVLGAISGVASALRAPAALRRLPPRWCTPMEFLLADGSSATGRARAGAWLDRGSAEPRDTVGPEARP